GKPCSSSTHGRSGAPASRRCTHSPLMLGTMRARTPAGRVTSSSGPSTVIAVSPCLGVLERRLDVVVVCLDGGALASMRQDVGLPVSDRLQNTPTDQVGWQAPAHATAQGLRRTGVLVGATTDEKPEIDAVFTVGPHSL